MGVWRWYQVTDQGFLDPYSVLCLPQEKRYFKIHIKIQT